MAKRDHFPTRAQLEDYIDEIGHTPSIRELARAFRLKREDHDRLKELLGNPSSSAKEPPRRATPRLPPVLVLDITGFNAEGELIGVPAVKALADSGIQLVVAGTERTGDSPKVGDRVLAKAHRSAGEPVARVMRILPPRENLTLLGVITKTPEGFLLQPVYRKEKRTFFLSPSALNGAKSGDLVEAEVEAGSERFHKPRGSVIRVLGRLDNPHAASHIAIHRLGIPVDFPDEALNEAAAYEQISINDAGTREDLRDLPLITIDGEDARDFDDAVHAEPDTSPNHPGGWNITVAIADVAHYVAPGSALDMEALRRGNSVYFPDRVVPMLPEALSNGLCSLKPEEERFCLCAHITIDAHGVTRAARFSRAIMRSVARRTYTDIQQEVDSGHPSEIVKHLFGAYAALKRHIDERGPLELNLPEYRARMTPEGKVTAIEKVKRLESHQLIEAYMVAANIAVADYLSHKRQGAIFRVHATPDPLKLRALKDIMDAGGYRFALGGKTTAKQFNGILRQAEADGAALAIHNAVLRTQMQAFYSPHNDGHFGLALSSYCHFTSPIRRYADLIVHRALIEAMGWEKVAKGKEKSPAANSLQQVAEHISTTERRAMQAERDAMDRYTAAFMEERVGATFSGHISGVTDAGLFVTLDDTGAEGFVPKQTLSTEHFHFDKKGARLTGARSGTVYTIGHQLEVVLSEVAVATGSLRFRLAGGAASEKKSSHHRPSRPKNVKTSRTKRKRR